MHTDYDFVIVGGGMAADAAAKGLREEGATGTIAMVGAEDTGPFPRPVLSKDLWLDDETTVEDSAFDTSEVTGATMHLGAAVTAVDTEAKQVTTTAGDTVGYGRLLVATGGTPRTIDGLEPGERVVYFRTLADYERLRAAATDGTRVAVVGAGYIGSEIALSTQDCTVTVLHPGEVIGDVMFPRPVAERLESVLVQAGVDVLPGTKVTGGRVGADAVTLDLDGGGTYDCDLVVVGLGVAPSTDFLRGTLDLDDDGGVVVDDHLRTSAPDVWAAGDIASYPDPVLGRTRVEHEDNALQQGEHAGRAMAGAEGAYEHTPVFYSDVLDVGTLDPSLETYVDVLDAESDQLVVYYLDDDAVRGVLMWNLFEGVEEATALIAKGSRPADPAELAGSVPG